MRFLPLFGLLVAASASAEAQPADVHVLAALQGLHAREPSFDYDALRRVIEDIRPEVMMLEVTPEELSGRLQTRGRPEYPNVIWPMLAKAGAPHAYAMEAGQPLYGELTQAAGRAWSDFNRDHPDRSKALDAYTDAADAALLAYWTSPAQAQDAITDGTARAAARLSEALVPATVPVQRRWEGAMIRAAKQAITKHPGKRILILASYRNRFVFTDALATVKGVRIIDMSERLSRTVARR